MQKFMMSDNAEKDPKYALTHSFSYHNCDDKGTITHPAESIQMPYTFTTARASGMGGTVCSHALGLPSRSLNREEWLNLVSRRHTVWKMAVQHERKTLRGNSG